MDRYKRIFSTFIFFVF